LRVERVNVVAVGPGWARVTAAAQEGCERCARGEGCGGAVLGLLGSRGSDPVEVAVAPGVEYAAGDLALLGVGEGALDRALAVAYGLPLVGLLAGAWLGARVADDLGALCGALLGAGAALLGARQLAPRAALRPLLLRRLSPGTDCR
jgi:sigma-E factor negative regulatory protein RseC